jgi:hypothetical protein
MGTRSQLRHRVANVLAAVPRASLWWNWWRLWLAGRGGCGVVRACRFSHCADGGRPSAGGFVRLSPGQSLGR